MPTLQVPQPLSTTAQPVSDETGARSSLHLSANAIGIATTSPDTALDIGGDVKLEYNGSPRLTLYSRGNGTQRYSLRVTNDSDPAGSRLLVIRNESVDRDFLTLDENCTLTMEHRGSPKISLHSRGDGTHKYSIRVTNNDDGAGGRLFVVRNETQSQDVLVIDHNGNMRVSGDITLPGGDCAEQFRVADDSDAGTVMVIHSPDTLDASTLPYDSRVAGVISGGGGLRPGVILAGRDKHPSCRPVAINGTVFCKVDASSAPVNAGDLLVTAGTRGHAMKALDRDRAFGAVLGKALSPLAHGVGSIPILVSLQ